MAPQPGQTDAPPDPSQVQWDAPPDPSKVTWDTPARQPGLMERAATGIQHAVVEPVAQFATGAGATAAGAAAGLYAGTAEEQEALDKYHLTAGQAFEQGWDKMKDVFHNVTQQYTYSGDPNNFWSKQMGFAPESQTGQNVARKIGYLPAKATEYTAKGLKRAVVDPAARGAELLGASPETVGRMERVGADISEIAAPFALGGAGRVLGAAGEATGVGAAAQRFNRSINPQAAQAATQQAARQAGYYVPEGPLASYAGRAKLDEGLSRRHEPINNQNARQTVGLAGNAPVDPAELETVRTQAYADSYDQLAGPIQMGPGLGKTNYSAFKQEIANASRNVGDVDQLIAHIEDPALTRGQNVQLRAKMKGDLIRDVEGMQKQFYKQRFDAQAMAAQMKQLRADWDKVKGAGDPLKMDAAQIRAYVKGMVGRNIADTLQQTLDLHAERTAPQLLPQLRQASDRLNNSYVLEDARLPNGNISAQRVRQIEDSGRQVTGGLKTMADVHRNMPGIVQDLQPTGLGLLDPVQFLGKFAQASWPEKLRLANQAMSATLGVGAKGIAKGVAGYEAWIHHVLPKPLIALAASTSASRFMVRRMLMGHRYNQRAAYRAAQPPRAPRRPPGPAALTGADIALSEMDQGNGSNLTR